MGHTPRQGTWLLAAIDQHVVGRHHGGVGPEPGDAVGRVRVHPGGGAQVGQVGLNGQVG